jgi:hypothetical protein
MKRITLSILIAVGVLGFSTPSYCQKDKEVREKPDKTDKSDRDKGGSAKGEKPTKEPKESPGRGSGGGIIP